MSDIRKGLSRVVTEKNVQVKPVSSTPISHYAPPKPAAAPVRDSNKPAASSSDGRRI